MKDIPLGTPLVNTHVLCDTVLAREGHRAAGAGEGPNPKVAPHVSIQRAPLAEGAVAQRTLESVVERW